MGGGRAVIKMGVWEGEGGGRAGGWMYVGRRARCALCARCGPPYVCKRWSGAGTVCSALACFECVHCPWARAHAPHGPWRALQALCHAGPQGWGQKAIRSHILDHGYLLKPDSAEACTLSAAQVGCQGI